MKIETKTGIAKSMLTHHTQEQIDMMVKQRFAQEIAHKILESGIFEVKHKYLNGINDELGVEYWFNCYLMNEKELNALINKLKGKR